MKVIINSDSYFVHRIISPIYGVTKYEEKDDLLHEHTEHVINKPVRTFDMTEFGIYVLAC